MARTDEEKIVALRALTFAWLVTSIFYLYQYLVREAPDVMVPQIAKALQVTPLGLNSLFDLFFYGYALFSLLGGLAIDRFGPARVVPIGAVLVATGAFLFDSSSPMETAVGRFLQGAGGAFALLGAIYVATTNIPDDRRATVIGTTQVFGTIGAFAGQFVVGPTIAIGLEWRDFWPLMGIFGMALALLLFLTIRAAPSPRPRPDQKQISFASIRAVFENPQSILCGVIAGLLFMPTTLFDMVWGVRFLEEARNLPYEEAVMRSSAVLMGWVIGCPVLGALSDRIGRRKPVIIGGAAFLFGCMALALFHKFGVLPIYSLGLVAGIASGAAMLPYTVVMESNPPEVGTTAIGFLNFINFSMAALLGPGFGILMTKVSSGGPRGLVHYQIAFAPLMYGVGLAMILALFLRETGPAPHPLKVPLLRGARLETEDDSHE